ILGPTHALEGIEAEVGDVRYVHMVFLAEPAAGLVDKAILVVINANRAERALAEIKNLVSLRRPLARDQIELIVAVEVVLIGAIAKLHALEQLILDVWASGGCEE